MHPEIGEPRAAARLGLRDLVGVVDRDVVLAAAVDVEVVAEVLLRHRRALDVPAGEAPAPRAVPFHLPLLARGRELPQREVGRVALLAQVDAPAPFETGEIEAREMAVVGQAAGVEVDAVGGAVGVALRLDVGDELDLLGDVVGRAAEHRRRLEVQRLHVREERVGVHLRDLPRRLAGAARALLHLVLAGVGVGRQVADVGDVHHVPDAVAVPLEHALQQVLEQERAEVADVLVVVDGRAAGVEADFAGGLQRLERAQGARVVVVEVQGGRHAPVRRSQMKPPAHRPLLPRSAAASDGSETAFGDRGTGRPAPSTREGS